MKCYTLFVVLVTLSMLHAQYDTVHVLLLGENINTKAIEGILLAEDTKTHKLTDFNALYPKEPQTLTQWAWGKVFTLDPEAKAKEVAKETVKAQTNSRYAFHSNYIYEEKTWQNDGKTDKVYIVKVPYIQAKHLNNPFMLSPSAVNQWRKKFKWFTIDQIKNDQNVDTIIVHMVKELMQDVTKKLEGYRQTSLQSELGQLVKSLELLKETLRSLR